MAKNDTKIVISAEDKATQILRKLEGQVGVTEGSIARFSATAAAAGATATVALVGGLTAATKSFANYADEIGDSSQATGTATESLSALRFAADLGGSSADNLEQGLKKLSSTIFQTSKASQDSGNAFKTLGIDITDTDGKLKSSDQTLLDIAERFSTLPDGVNKTALAIELFGKSGADLIPFLNQGRDGIGALTAEAERFGLVVSGEAAEAAGRFNDNLDRVGKQVDGVKNRIGAGLLPIFDELLTQFIEGDGVIGSLSGEISDLTSSDSLREWAESASKTTAVFVDAFRAVSFVVGEAGANIGAFAASAALAAQGEFSQAADVIKFRLEDFKENLTNFDFSAATDGTNKFYEELDKTVREGGFKFVFNTKADADLVRAEFAKLAADQKAGMQDVTAFSEEQLKIQENLRKDANESALKDTLGANDFAIAKIKEKFQVELDAIKGATDEVVLRANIEKKIQAEIDALYANSLQMRTQNEQQITTSVMQEAEKRVNVERNAAAEVIQYWSQANVARAAETGGVIRNAGTAGEFVSSWDANGNYVGEYTGFANGGSFRVGGSGGTDSQLVQFRASPDERVTIETPQQMRERSSGSPIINITMNGVNDVVEMTRKIQQHLRSNPNALSASLVRAG